MDVKSKTANHNQNLPVYDVADLKDKIRELKLLQQTLQREKDQLLIDIASKEKGFTKYRQELTLLEPTKDLRWQNADSIGEDAVNANEVAKYNLINEKLEMQVLTQELYQALPVLEQKMKLYEDRAQNHSKSLPKGIKTLIQQAYVQAQQQKKSPMSPRDGESIESMVWKSSPELTNLISQRINEILERKKSQTLLIETAQQKNQQLINELIPLRHCVELMFQEKAELTKENSAYINKNIQQHRLEFLTTQTKTLRNKLRKHENGFGWQKEIFFQFLSTIRKEQRQDRGEEHKNNGGSNNATAVFESTSDDMTTRSTMPLSEVAKCLQYLIFPTSSRVQWKEESFLRSLLSEVYLDELLQQERQQQATEQRLNNKPKNEIQLDSEKDIKRDKNDMNVDDNDSLFDEEVEELLIIPSSNNKHNQANHPATATWKISSAREDQLRKEAVAKSDAIHEIDVKEFSLLCNRLINAVE